MYNKFFDAEFTAMHFFKFLPEGGSEKKLGSTLSAEITIADTSFFDDLTPPGAMRDAMREILGGKLPISGDVGLKYVHRNDLTITVGIRHIKVDIDEIVALPIQSLGSPVKAKIKFSIRPISPADASYLLTLLKDVSAIRINAKQGDFFDPPVKDEKEATTADPKALPPVSTKALGEGKGKKASAKKGGGKKA
jgi:hypothetical protein